MKKFQIIFSYSWFFLVLLNSFLNAQPANDLCSNASVINFGAGNFGTGVFTSSTFDLTNATRDIGENFHSTLVSAGNDKKSVWFKFTLPTARGVKIELKQPGNAIAQSDAGFTTYLSSTCNPPLTAVEPAKLTPINKFGSSFNPCLVPGEYLVQVSSKLNANGPIFLEITVSLPGVTNDYDFPSTAQNLGTLSAGTTTTSTYDVGCQTIENASETCPALTNSAHYTQTTWHVFRTPAAIDFLRIRLKRNDNGNFVAGYTLYQGDIRTAGGSNPWTSLTTIDGCKEISGGTSTQNYFCNLLPNTYYSIQLFYHKDSMFTFRIELDMIGAGQTQSPLNASAPYMNPTMQLGNINPSPGGTLVSRTDVWACNARTSINPCPSVKPSAGYTYSSITYDLNDWVTFTSTAAANIQITTNSGCKPMYVRVYNGDVNNDCNLTLYDHFLDDKTLLCVPAGTYSIQLLGRSGSSNPFDCNISHLAQSLSIQLKLTSVVASNTYNLTNTGAALEKINSNNPLPDNVQIFSNPDVFGCNNTILPSDYCSGQTKAIYRVLTIGDSDGDGFNDSGFLTIGGLNSNFVYKIYRGNVASATSGGSSGTFNISPHLTDISGCVTPPYNNYQMNPFCVYPGVYTIVTFGDASDVGRSDQIWVRFNKIQSQFNLSAAGRIDRINYSGGAFQNLVSNTTYLTTLDRFDCNQTVLPPNACGSGTDRAIYRVFKIGQKGIVNITGSCYTQYRLYAGDASAYGGPYTYPNTVTGLTQVSNCFTCNSGNICLSPGIYTLVAFGNSNSPNTTDQPSIYYKALTSQFNLANATRFNAINNMNPLVSGTNYVSTYDIFDCDPTVLPGGTLCGSGTDRAIYREFTIGSSGILLIYGTCGNQYRLYAGRASQLATSFSHPSTIPGLNPVTNCFYGSCYGGSSIQLCVAPGSYTLVTFGNASSPNVGDQPSITFTQVTTSFDDPTAGRVNHMGNANNGAVGTVDYFSCLNNPRTIDGVAPCFGATKQIYREFELTQPTHLSISGGVGTHVLFTGWASDPGGWSNLHLYNPSGGTDPIYGARNWQCFASQSTTPCFKLPPGKYTIVSYGNSSNLAQADNVTITKIPDYPAANFNRPGLASQQGNVSWNVAADGVAYPMTKQTYTFATARFDCSRNLPGILNGCDPFAPGPANDQPPHQGNAFNRAAFYTFNLTNEAYLRIQDIPTSMRVQLFPLDARTNDSLLFNTTTPIQDCIVRWDINMGYYCPTLVGEIEICKLQPRVYTLVIYATDNQAGSSVTPRLTFEKVEVSRFDHASTAYDFGNVPGDNVLRYGKVGDTNPIHSGRAPSNDFFTCTTGARRLDPGRSAYYYAGAKPLDTYAACWAGQYPAYPPVQADTSSVPYPMPNNYALFYDPMATDTTAPPIRRNLWYTFTVTGGGTVTVRVDNKTTGETNQVPFSVYKSDVNGSLPFSAIAGTADNDSTLAMGLTFVGNNVAPYYYCCYNQNTVTFTRDACSNSTDRYYIIVDHNIYNELNNQIEVGIQFNGIPSTPNHYDFYSWANHIINATGQPANGPLGTIPLSYGWYRGTQSNFVCRTNSPASDQASCAPRSIWYVVDVGISGRMRINYGVGTDTTYNPNEMVLYRELVAGDSTTVGLLKLNPTTVYGYGRAWGEVCVTPGRYYIMMTGCSYTTQVVQPQVWLLGRPVTQDFYSHAGTIGSGVLTNGTYSGDTITFACATRSTPDPNPCGQRTLWYKFQVGTSGKIRVRYNIIGSGFTYNDQNIELYYSNIPGDSVLNVGLIKQTLTAVYASGSYWGQTCMKPGTYYLLLTGCWYTTEDVYAQIHLIEEPGDFCTNAISIPLNNGGTANGTATVDCHTIGEAFGEDGSNMACLFGPNGYKSTWFRVDFTSTQKYDMTFQLIENTSALPNQIRYRILYGTCGAMTAGPCNSDALTQFTLNCMETGAYYVQVITPANATGTVSFQVTTTLSPDQTCVPLNPNKPIANFTVNASCEGEPVQFINQSTQGSDISYHWDFGVIPLTNDTSNLKDPTYTYPVTGTVQTYNVKLVVTNHANGEKDSVTIPVIIFPKPGANITHVPTTVTAGVPVDFFSNATNTITTPVATTYLWDFGPNATPTSSTDVNPTGVIFNSLGTTIVSVTVTNGTCSYTDKDTFVVGTEPIFNGGPFDGHSMGEFEPCPMHNTWAGGPYDGHSMSEFEPCPVHNTWAGGPYDGHSMSEFEPCPVHNTWAGGPFDGHDMAELNINITSNVGPYNSTICAGTAVTLTASYSGPGTVTYQWFANNVLLPGETNQTLNVAPTQTTTYRVNTYREPATACFDSLEQEFTIIVTPAPVADAGPDVSTCGDSVTIGTPAVFGYTYSWSPVTGLSNPNIAQPRALPSSTTTYTLTVSANGGACPNATDNVVVTVNTPPALSAGNDTSACFPGSVNLTASGADVYIWQQGITPLANNPLVASLPNANFTGSTQNAPFYAFSQAKTSGNGWRPTVNNTNQYLQIDLGTSRAIHSVATQGSFPNYVTTYQISYTDEAVPTTWTYYTENGAVRTFNGNTDAFTLVTNSLANLIRARHVRFHPLTWVNGIGMRVEVYTDNARLSLNNPYAATSVGTYVVHGRSLNCPNTYKDTVVVTNKASQKLVYRSRQNGHWTNLTTWQVYIDGSWVNAETVTCPPVSYPTSADSTIWVRDSVYYDFTIPVGIDEVKIDPPSGHNPLGGIIHVPFGVTLNLVNGTNSPDPIDMFNNGKLNIVGDLNVAAGALLENTDPSTVAYLRNGNQTMWNGKYGILIAGGSGEKTVGGTNTLVRTHVQFLNAFITLNNRNITLDTLCTISNAGLTTGFFVTNGFGSVIKNKLDSGTPFMYPVGPSTSSYNRAILANSGTSDNYGVRVTGSFDFDPNFPADELELNTSVNRTWYLSEVVPGGSNLSLTLHWYAAHENAGFDRNNCVVGEYRNTTGWTRLGIQTPAGGTTEFYQSASNITTPQIYSVGSCQITPMDYRTIADGNWTDLNIWEVLNPADGNWYRATLVNTMCGSVSYPTSASRTILVRHNVLYDYSIPIGVDQVRIASNGKIKVPTGINFLLKDGPGTDFNYPANSTNGIDLENEGYFEIEGTFTLDVPTSWLVNQNNSWVEYSGGDQTMWNGSYAKLKLTGSLPNAAHQKTISGNTTEVREELAFNNAKMILNNFNVLLKVNATVSGASQNNGYIVATSNGYCVWEYNAGTNVGRTYPIGGVYYSPAEIIFDNVTNAGTLSGRVKETVHPNRTWSIKRYWTMTQGTVNFSGEYTGRFNYNDMDLPYVPTTYAEEAQMVEIAGIYNPAYSEPGGWRLSPIHISYTQFLSINVGQVRNDAFSDFTFFPAEVLLPVSYVILSAEWDNQNGKLQWFTPIEEGISHYVVERSIDGVNYQPIGQVNAQYNNGQQAVYPYLDTEVSSLSQNKFIYRIQQVDLQGNFVYSNSVELLRQSPIQSFTIYPNPMESNRNLYVKYTSESGTHISLKLYETTGKLVLVHDQILNDIGEFEVPIGKLAAGMYYVNIQTPTDNYVVKLVVY